MLRISGAQATAIIITLIVAVTVVISIRTVLRSYSIQPETPASVRK